MRKTAAILLLMLLVFNTIGYKMWFKVAIISADNKLEAALDRNTFNNQQLFTLKIPINLPYQNSTSEFERVNGDITINGETYKYVQRKITNDTLFLQCIKNTEKNNLQQRSNDYFAKVNDVAGNNMDKKMPGKSTTLIKFTLSDYITDIYLWKCVQKVNTPCVYLTKPFAINSSEHLRKLIKPPQTA